jgi:hypothetical protein
LLPTTFYREFLLGNQLLEAAARAGNRATHLVCRVDDLRSCREKDMKIRTWLYITAIVIIVMRVLARA